MRPNGVDAGVEAATRLPVPMWVAVERAIDDRRSAVDRRTATMMYASRNRSKAIRRWLPLNRGARDAFAKKDAGRNAGLDRLRASGHHRHADAADPRGGPFTLTEGWSHQRGGRQR